ncbi:hypothetical protein A3A75_01660 [Candidatus Woesebacteria bacterium RIFCSPLOWO2_01_FULL_39_10]|uniref:Glycosyltransferase RgtA/B/C/D-like domain-containing protein n=1 Tax=Candidatus Woesebacteria bacterium RIFCSPLOWO2_01_FULL_39_10 TaxID=1802516 RepID=A0A1F8B7V3_9BACT|nr:MAG: hypothetical protein A3A75_01660 [Candidatus Woesebacteria bacterium RIFCSPLOWO2_01_FULL_39_10]
MEKTSLKEKFMSYNLPVQAGSRLKNWIRKNRLEALFIAIILLVGAFFRLYRIDEYMTFLGDEGRDVLIVRRLLVNFDPILVGPGTSIGNMYLGPLYYYMMAPALLLANFSPAGPAVMIALLGVLTIFFVWTISREWFGKIAALLASLLYATAPVVITYSRSSWNPNIMPFFSLLCIYAIWKVWRRSYRDTVHDNEGNDFKWLVILGISFAFVLQSHYLGLLLAPVIGLFWLLSYMKIKSTKQVRNFVKFSIVGLGIFTVLMSPLLIFDARHGWRNFSAIKKFFTERQTTVSARPWTSIPKLPEVTDKMVTRLVVGTNEVAGNLPGKVFLTALTALAALMIYIIKAKRRSAETWSAYLVLIIWIGISLIGLALYKQEIYDHYYGFFFTAPFLLIGGISQSIINKHKIFGSLVVILVAGYLLVVNLQNNLLKYPPNRQLQRSIEVAKKIAEESGGQKFNLAVIAERNYEGAYQYFLESWSEPFVMIDPQKTDETITEQLYVICEYSEKEKCDPTHNPKAEIANFGWTKIEDEWQVSGVTLYKLTHTK